MNAEELAFANQQLAGMLRAGIPLEGALAQLCREMRQGPLRKELQALAEDLTRGRPFAEAVAERQLPDFYAQMIRLGAATGDLPAALILVADHYQRRHTLGTRLGGLLVYPVLVLLGLTALTSLIVWVAHRLGQGPDSLLSGLLEFGGSAELLARNLTLMWVPLIVIGLLLVALVVVLASPHLCRTLRWRTPGFRESALSQLASSLSLMLDKGCPLPDALGFAIALENGSPAGADLTRWRSQVAAGIPRPADWMAGARILPPLFTWLVAQAGEDLAAGFRRAADVYYARALYRLDLLLYLALPLSVLLLGAVLLTQLLPLFQMVIRSLDSLGGMGG